MRGVDIVNRRSGLGGSPQDAEGRFVRRSSPLVLLLPDFRHINANCRGITPSPVLRWFEKIILLFLCVPLFLPSCYRAHALG